VRFVSVEVEPATTSARTSAREIFTPPPGISIASDCSSSRIVATANRTGSTQNSRMRIAAAGIASM